MKQGLNIKSVSEQFQAENTKSLKESILFSLKHGLTTFVILLSSLRLFGIIVAELQGKPIIIYDKIDLAIAFLGFLLMFIGKFLERFYGKH